MWPGLSQMPGAETSHLTLAMRVLAVDPVRLGGLWLRGRAGPIRQQVTDALAHLPCAMPLVRLSAGADDQALFGGLDPVSSLAAGRPVRRQGLCDAPGVLVLPMAEAAPAGLVARLAQALDGGLHGLIALDEAAEDGEGLAPALADRLGLFVDLTNYSYRDMPDLAWHSAETVAARALLPRVGMTAADTGALVVAAARLGIASNRAVLLAVRVARVLAALDGRETVAPEDLALAAALSLAHRGILFEDAPADDPPPPQDQPDTPQDESLDSDQQDQALADMLVEAARAALPQGLLESLASGRAARTARGARGTGAAKAGNRRGRPLPSRVGRPGAGRRVDLVATLRAAAPWQPLRRRDAPGSALALLVQPGDLHLRRYREVSDRVLIFVVDASGSSAVARLAEAKGAVELLLGQAYSRRDHVALVVFRGRVAEVLLPPTRSLVRAKKSLRGAPGGGGTPLASGLEVALKCALAAQARGMTPSLAILTDGRGNIALNGEANRATAQADAETLARAIGSAGVQAVVLDVSNRPQPALGELARLMCARYEPLPRADARRIAQTLG